MTASTNQRALERPATLFIVFAVFVGAFWLAGDVLTSTFHLEFGTDGNLIHPSFFRLAIVWSLFGWFGVRLLAEAVVNARFRLERLLLCTRSLTNGQFLTVASVLAFALPVAIRVAILHNAPITDDEGGYLLSARLLATGRLWVTSPPMKLFYDQNFIINDGMLYSQYFLGWPALLATGVALGIPEAVNPLLSALTVPPLFWVLCRLTSDDWGRLGVALFLATPMFQLAAASMLSHTACIFAVAWALEFLYRSRERPDVVNHSLLALAMALGVFVRPQSAVPLILPLGVSWLIDRTRQERGARGAALCAFLAPATAAAVLFFYSQASQTGSPLVTGYQRYNEYIRENDFRFTTLNESFLTPVSNFVFSGFGPAMTRTALGMFRFNTDLFGWPSSFLFVVFLRKPAVRIGGLAIAMTMCFLVFNFFQRDWGIDIIGPTHALEMGLPLIVLTIVSGFTLTCRPAAKRRLAPALLIAAVVTSWCVFVPVRLRAISRSASFVERTITEPIRRRIHQAVIFSPWPFMPDQCSAPGNYVLFRPVNDPDLDGDIIWVNHLDLERDRALLGTLPGRTGYLMTWNANCEIALQSLEEITGTVPAGLMYWR